MKKRTLQWPGLLLATLTMVSYQNCSRSASLPGSSDALSTGVGSKGNGDSYEGKITEYNAVDYNESCHKGKNFAAAIIRIDEQGNASTTRQNCTDIEPIGIPLQDYDVTPDAPEVLTTNGQLFEEKTYLASTSNSGIWACRANLPPIANGNRARITIRIVSDLTGAPQSIISYGIYDESGKLLSVRRTNSFQIDHELNKNIHNDGFVERYSTKMKKFGRLDLKINPESKQGIINFHFHDDPHWKRNTETSETKDQDVLEPLGRFHSEKVICYGNERSSP